MGKGGEMVRRGYSVEVEYEGIVWFQEDGGWKDHVRNRIGIAEKR